MAAINETLTLTDAFSASFHSFNALAQQSVSNADRLDSTIREMADASRFVTVQGMNEINQTLIQIRNNTERATTAQRDHTRELNKTNLAAKAILSTIRNIAIASGALSLAKSFLQFSDTQAQITARLNLMNDGLQTTAQLNEMIYQSALRSRSAYGDTADAIGKMGLNAGNAFSSNQELIAFMEQVNKQFKIGGASADAQRNAMVQLTQAMGAGALRGEELNSILDAAPGIARTIEQSMGWASGSIKQYAEDGAVTAQVVKNALLDMADETNRKFNEMPMTLGDAMTQVQNVVQHSVQDMAAEWNDFINSAQGQELLGEAIALFSVLAEVGVDALSAIGQGALLVADNLDFILPILAAIGVAYAILHAQAIATAAGHVTAALTTAAAWAVAHWPILLLVVLLSAAMIAAQQFGIGFQEVGGWVGQVFGMIYGVGYNVFATLWNVIASFAEFFANVFNDPVGAVVRLFFNALDSILSMVESVAGAVDALTGSDLQSAVSGFRSNISSWVDDTFGKNAIQIKRMASLDIGATSREWGSYASGLGEKLDNLSLNIGDLAGSFGDLSAGEAMDIGNVANVGKVKNVEGDVNLADEDIKIYRDLAERRYMNNIELQTLAPQINVSIPESAAKNLTSQDIADKLKAILIEQASAHTAVAHG